MQMGTTNDHPDIELLNGADHVRRTFRRTGKVECQAPRTRVSGHHKQLTQERTLSELVCKGVLPPSRTKHKYVFLHDRFLPAKVGKMTSMRTMAGLRMERTSSLSMACSRCLSMPFAGNFPLLPFLQNCTEPIFGGFPELSSSKNDRTGLVNKRSGRHPETRSDASLVNKSSKFAMK